MEKLNEYLQTLLSTCSYELHLEPNKTPYVVNTDGNTEVANTPLLGTQISTIIFPLIPLEAKQQLPNQDQIEFTHSHHLGNFSVLIQKSPAGFNVTIRPMLAEGREEQSSSSNGSMFDQTLPQSASNPNTSSTFTSSTPPREESDSSANSYYYNPDRNEKAEATALPEEPNSYFEDNSVYSLEETEDSFNYDSEKIEIEEIQADYRIEDYDKTETETAPAYETFGQAQTSLPVQSHEKTPVPSEEFRPSPAEQSFEASVAQSLQTPDEYVAAPILHSDNLNASARMDALFAKMAETGASDLHLSVSMPPMIRRDGKMMPLECAEGELTAETSKQLLHSIMPRRNMRNSTDSMILILLTRSKVWRVFGPISLWIARVWAEFSGSFRPRS